ncbi:hypothetical protein ACEPAF_4261 [Sanghuangporus sanghuang]
MDNYPSGNKELIKSLSLIKHSEGGYFYETDRQELTIPSPFADNQARSLATSIFYLLTHDDPTGVIHMNKSVTYHVLHQGRAEYTLIAPGVAGKPPTIEKKVMGPNAAAGELRMLFVGTGIWKMSRLLPEDLAVGITPEKADKVGCLIHEIVVPGFHWEDHQFLTKEKLDALFEGSPDKEEKIKLFASHVKKSG